MEHYVIVGNGVAAVGCVEGIRQLDTKNKITIISEENHPVYSRPLISYYLERRTTLEKMSYRDSSFYEKMNCDVLYGRTATDIDVLRKTLTLDDHSSVSYDKICIATGSSPFIPPFAGLESVNNKFTFLTMDDMSALDSAITPSSRILIVGAGLIGLKCAEGLSQRVQSITVCDLADHILSSILDIPCSRIVQTHLEKNGICFMLEDSAVCFEKNTAFMKSGAVIDFDILVLAVGVHANVSLVKASGGNVNRGIIINSKMETSLPEIYAAGDCTEGYDNSLGSNRILALLPNAYMQGHCAGINMAGGDSVFDTAIPMNSIGFFGLHIMTAGNCFFTEDDGELYEEQTPETYKKLYIHNGCLIGFMLIGNTGRAGIYTSLIREKIPLDTVDFDLLKRETTSAVFSKKIRKKMFGGVV